jgi:hypothetical protein
VLAPIFWAGDALLPGARGQPGDVCDGYRGVACAVKTGASMSFGDAHGFDSGMRHRGVMRSRGGSFVAAVNLSVVRRFGDVCLDFTGSAPFNLNRLKEERPSRFAGTAFRHF